MLEQVHNYHDERLLKTDYHGCMLSIQLSMNPSHVGLYGIVVHESKNTFQLVTPKDKLIGGRSIYFLTRINVVNTFSNTKGRYDVSICFWKKGFHFVRRCAKTEAAPKRKKTTSHNDAAISIEITFNRNIHFVILKFECLFIKVTK